MIDEKSVDELLALQRETEHELSFSFEEAFLKHFGYQVIDEVAAYLTTMRERPVWKPMPGKVRATIRTQELLEQGYPFEGCMKKL